MVVVLFFLKRVCMVLSGGWRVFNRLVVGLRATFLV